MRPSSIAALILTLPLLPGVAFGWPGHCKYGADRSVSLPAAGVTRLEIVGRGGDLKVRSTSSPAIAGSGRACASSEAMLEQTQIRSTQDGSNARVFVQVPDDLDSGYATLDLTVLVPAGVTVEVTDTSGDTDVESVQLAHVTDSSGDVVVRDVTGDLEVNDSSGDVRLTNVDGALTVTDSSGDLIVDTARSVRVLRDSSGDMRIERISGNVVIETDSSGDIEIDHVGGNVEVLSDSTGDRSIHDVKGTIRVPED